LGDGQSVTTEKESPASSFAELCKNFTFSQSKHYFWGLDFEALSKSLITVIIVFAARDSEAHNEKQY
jgi:hypothetical protein